MNLDNAVHSHAQWKLRFREAILNKEHVDAEVIARDDCCEVGRWLHGEGALHWGERAEFLEARAKHKAFHVQAGLIAQLINSGEMPAAERALESGSTYARASSEVAICLIALKRIAGP